MWRHYVYIHFRESDGIPFYVGKGAMRARNKVQNYDRARADHLNSHWQNTVNKHGLAINIVASCQSDIEAQRLEKEIIALIGRCNLGTGSLVNLTDGGDGHSGILVSEELRNKRRINSSGPRSEAFCIAVRAARKNGGNGGVVKHGDKLSESWRANLAAAKVGNKNPQFGKSTKIARKVIDDQTNEIYSSVSKAALAYNMKMKSLYNLLSGHRPNYTPLRFYDGV